MQERMIDVSGPVHVVDHGGDGPAMVLVHGLGGASINWMAVGPALAERAHEGLQVLPEQLERLPQERELDRPLALLDEVQVRGRDADLLGDVGLAQAAVHAQLSELVADTGVVHLDISTRSLAFYMFVDQ